MQLTLAGEYVQLSAQLASSDAAAELITALGDRVQTENFNLNNDGSGSWYFSATLPTESTLDDLITQLIAVRDAVVDL